MDISRKKRGRKAAVWGLVVMAVLFILLLGRLFALRFEAGDVLPAYSSLRSDPLGTRALFDSLNSLPHVTADRHFQPLNKIKNTAKSPSRRTIFIIGGHFFSPTFFGKEQLEAFDRLAADGDRIVIGYYPVQIKSYSASRLSDDVDEKDDEKKDKKKDDADSKKEKSGEDEPEKPQKTDSEEAGKKKEDVKEKAASIRENSLEKHWGYKLKLADDEAEMKTAQAGPAAPENWPREISWHSRVSFDQLDKKWRVLYGIDEMPVLIERRVGRGSVVLVADSYLFSNEALLKERQPAMLAWLVSPGAGDEVRVVFDEAHLGIHESENIAVLLRKYKLYWPLAALVLLAGLYIWKNAVSLAPPPDENRERRGNIHSSGRDSFSGLVSLMRRSIPSEDIVKVCYDEWRHTYTLEKDQQAVLDRLAAELENQPKGRAKEAGLVEKYRYISNVLAKGRPWKKARTS